MDYNTCKYLNGIILEDILKYWIVFSIQESRAKYILLACLGRALTIFMHTFLSLRVYLVLVESKIEKQFS